NSNLSVKEIANEMHFNNQSFMAKYFKFHVGMTPTEYRKR
ncbi:MAG: helix-turn-helix domain-containing protein, partial [Prevotella sp.]